MAQCGYSEDSALPVDHSHFIKTSTHEVGALSCTFDLSTNYSSLFLNSKQNMIVGFLGSRTEEELDNDHHLISPYRFTSDHIHGPGGGRGDPHM